MCIRDRFITFVLYPQIKNIYIAFTDYSIMPGAETPFAGLSNFQRAFEGMFERGTDAYYFWISFRNNILAVLVTVPGQLVLGPVSYTHLDVYKRQPPTSSSPRGRPPPTAPTPWAWRSSPCPAGRCV